MVSRVTGAGVGWIRGGNVSHNYRARVTQCTVAPEGGPIYDEQVTRVTIADETCGEFVVVEQDGHAIRIGRPEWPAIRRAINRMMRECQ